jgi:PPM family protein phosphatase
MPTEPRSATLRCAAASDMGRRRKNNEDRVHCDVERGFFVVIDGVGGHVAGERAADIALASLRSHVERGTDNPADRLRTAITAAHLEICQQAALDSTLSGMGCVVTALLIEERTATVGHVGDTRLYQFRPGVVTKITHDHSPIGEQEESGALTEAEAMHHQMRNQVYRALGVSGAQQQPGPGGEFVEIHQLPVEDDSAFLLCTDGLSDSVPLAEILRTVEQHAADPELLVRRLIDAANAAGGKDNVTVAFVSAEGFAASAAAGVTADRDTDAGVTLEIKPGVGLPPRAPTAMRSTIWIALGTGLAGIAIGALLTRALTSAPAGLAPPSTTLVADVSRTLVVAPASAVSTIAGALAQAREGDTIVVEPGEYAERVRLVKGVALVSREPQRAILRPAGDGAAAITVDVQGSARIAGFLIVSAADRPIERGILIQHGRIEIDDVEIAGTSNAAVEIGPPSRVTLRSSFLHGNSGAGVAVRAGCTARIARNVIAHAGAPSTAAVAIAVDAGAQPVVVGNVMAGYGSAPVSGLDPQDRARVQRENFVQEKDLSSRQPAERVTTPKKPS